MPTSLFVNLPTQDLDRSKAFFEALGWTINPAFSDENAACVVITEHHYLMMLKPEFFSQFTDKPIANPRESCQVEVAFDVDSRDAVDAMMERALTAGGREPKDAQDHGYMYGRDFEDPDGNLFSVFWMDPVAAQQGPEASAAQEA